LGINAGQQIGVQVSGAYSSATWRMKLKRVAIIYEGLRYAKMFSLVNKNKEDRR